MAILSSSCCGVASRKKMQLQIPNRQLLKRLERIGKASAFRRRQATRAYHIGAYHPFRGWIITLEHTTRFAGGLSAWSIPPIWRVVYGPEANHRYDRWLCLLLHGQPIAGRTGPDKACLISSALAGVFLGVERTLSCERNCCRGELIEDLCICL